MLYDTMAIMKRIMGPECRQLLRPVQREAWVSRGSEQVSARICDSGLAALQNFGRASS